MSASDEAVVETFLRALWRSDREGAKAPFAPDADWWFLPSLGYPRPMRAVDAIDAVLDDMMAALADGGLSIDVTMNAMMSNADGEVAADYTARSRMPDGSAYENTYVLRASVRNGQIVRVSPYTDTGKLSALIESGAG
jgi:ketosteroid isomerase-like protein